MTFVPVRKHFLWLKNARFIWNCTMMCTCCILRHVRWLPSNVKLQVSTQSILDLLIKHVLTFCKNSGFLFQCIIHINFKFVIAIPGLCIIFGILLVTPYMQCDFRHFLRLWVALFTCPEKQCWHLCYIFKLSFVNWIYNLIKHIKATKCNRGANMVE